MKNKSKYAALALSLMAALAYAAPAHADYTATADPSIQFQPFQGWGTSLAWWAYVVGGFPEPARSDYMDKAFDPVKGLGLNVVRYNIGGGENPQSLKPNKQYLEYRTAVPGYEPVLDQWDWNADAGQRWTLRAAIARGANRYEAFSNSPPYWMTKSGSVTGNQGGKDNLKPESYDVFAAYLTAVVKHFYDAWAVNFHTLEPLNEPTNGWRFGNHQEGCVVDRPNQNTLVKAVGAAVARSGLPTTISASDETSISSADETTSYYDSTTLKSISRINTHSYGGGDRTRLSNFALARGKDLWLSEYGDGDASGMQMAGRINEDINGLHPSAWVYWQVVDSAGGWGFLKNPLQDETTTAYTFNKKYYVMANYSKFIRPGYRFIAINDPHSLAAYDAPSRTLVIVTVNNSDVNTTATYDLSQFTGLGPSATAYRTSATADLTKLPSVPITARSFLLAAPAKSVTTFVIAGAVYGGALGFDPNAYYTITNRQSRLTLEEHGDSPTDFTTVDQAPVVAGAARQQWRVVGQGGGVYKFVNRNDGLLMEVGGDSMLGGATVDLYHDKSEVPGQSNQQWKLVSVGNGYYEFVNSHSGLALENGAGNKSGAALQQNAYQNGANQQWQIVKATEAGQRRKDVE